METERGKTVSEATAKEGVQKRRSFFGIFPSCRCTSDVGKDGEQIIGKVFGEAFLEVSVCWSHFIDASHPEAKLVVREHIMLTCNCGNC